MTTPISNTPTATTPTTSPLADNNVVDRIEAKIKAKLPQGSTSTPPTQAQSQTTGTADVPTMPPPPPMTESEMSLLVSQMQTKTQDQSFAVSQSQMEQLNTGRKNEDNKVYDAINKMDHYKDLADKNKTVAQMGLNKVHGKFAHTIGSMVQDLSTEGVAAQIAEHVDNKKAGDAQSDMEGDQASSMKIGKQMKNAESQLKNITSALSQTASITSEMQDSSATAQDKILRGLQNQV